MLAMQAIQNRIPPQTISWLILAAWATYIVISPFYIFPKGRPQPADFLLISTMVPFLITLFLHVKAKLNSVYLLGGLFVVMTITINFINNIFFPDLRLMLTMLYYPYNFMIFIFISILCRKDPETFKRVTYFAIIASITIQFSTFGWLDTAYRGARATAGFENPNQFAYWSLSSPPR